MNADELHGRRRAVVASVAEERSDAEHQARAPAVERERPVQAQRAQRRAPDHAEPGRATDRAAAAAAENAAALAQTSHRQPPPPPPPHPPAPPPPPSAP